MKLYTTRTLLRRFDLSDLKDLVVLESDPEVMKHTRMRRPQTEEESFARLRKNIELQKERSPLGIWGAYLLQDPSELIGWVMLIKTDGDDPELGFMIPRKHWEKSFATEICQRIIKYADEDLQLPHIYAVTDSENIASQAVLKKLKFAEGASREPGVKYFYWNRTKG